MPNSRVLLIWGPIEARGTPSGTGKDSVAPALAQGAERGTIFPAYMQQLGDRDGVLPLPPNLGHSFPSPLQRASWVGAGVSLDSHS